MKPLLKSYVGVAPAADGVFIQAGQRSFLLKGRNLYPLISKLLAAFDGQHELDDVQAALPSHARHLLTVLIGELTRNGMVHMLKTEQVQSIPDDIAALYKPTITMLQDETPDFARYFQTWRHTPLTVAGAGHSFRTLACALAQSGACRLTLYPEHHPEVNCDRAAIEAKLAALGRENPDLEVRWVESAAPASVGATPRIFYANDDIPLNRKDSLLSELRQSGGSIELLGGVFRGYGLVGICAERRETDVLQVWRNLPVLADPVVFPISTRSVIGALIAFEALKADLYAADAEPETTHWPERNFFQITAAANITTHAFDAVRPGPLPPPPDSPPTPDTDWMLVERQRLEVAMVGAFDPLVGVLQWCDENIRTFPLPHQSLRVRTRQGLAWDNSPVVTHWGTTPQQVGLRTLCKAVATYASTYCPAAPKGANIVAAPMQTPWRELAEAHALVRSDIFSKHAQRAVVPADGIDDAQLLMLVRLTRLYFEQLPELGIVWVPGLRAFLARASAGARQARAVATSPVEALVESLGDLLSRWQIAASDSQQGQTDAPATLNDVAWPKRPVGLYTPGEIEAVPQTIELPRNAISWHQAHCPIFDGSGLEIGWAELVGWA